MGARDRGAEVSGSDDRDGAGGWDHAHSVARPGDPRPDLVMPGVFDPARACDVVGALAEVRWLPYSGKRWNCETPRTKPDPVRLCSTLRLSLVIGVLVL